MTKAQTAPTPGTPASLDEVLASAARLDTPDLERVQAEVNLLLARRRSPSISEQEGILLQKINHRSPAGLRKRYEVLHRKLQDEEITDTEHRELLDLLNQLEAANVEWLKNVADLARLRGVSPKTLMQQLGLSTQNAA